MQRIVQCGQRETQTGREMPIVAFLDIWKACEKPTASRKIIIDVTIKFPPILNANPKTECNFKRIDKEC